MSKGLGFFSVKNVLVWVLTAYKRRISPTLVKLFGNACRFTPSCSEYTIEAVNKYGTVKGLFLGLKRFTRCHPLGGSGYHPVE